MATKAAARRRLRALRALLNKDLSGDAPGALLFVCGVDGKDNWASSSVVRWLCLGESGSSLIDERPRPFNHDQWAALEETALLMTRDSLRVLYDAAAGDVLAPLLTCGAGGISEYVLPSTDDPEQREKDKVAKFERMLDAGLGPESRTLGVAIPSAASSAREECEYWPLVQALAAGGEKTFLSRRHDVVDASQILRQVLVAPDADLLREALRRATPALRRHVEEAFKNCRGPMGVKGDVAAEFIRQPLETFDEYDGVVQGEGGPLASIGCASLDLKEGDGDAHVVFQAREPSTGLRVCRTYFLRSGAFATLDGSKIEEDEALLTLSSTYADLCSKFREAAPSLDRLKKAFPSAAFYAQTTDCLGNVLQEEAEGSLTFVRVSVKTKFGVVAVGDTFLEGGGLLTGDRCAPYCKVVGASSGPERDAAEAIKRRLRDAHGPRSEELQLGKRLESYSHATLVLGFVDRDPVPHVGRLELYEDGFVLADGGLAPLVVSFARQDCSKIAVVQVSKDAHGVAMELKDPSHLRAGSIVDASYAVLVVRKHAPARRAVDGSIERWRRHCSREDARELVKQAQDAAARCWTEEALGLSRGLSDVQDAKVEALIDAYAERSGSRTIDRLFGASSNEAPAKKGPPAYLIIGEPGSGVADVACAVLRRIAEVDQVKWHHCEALRVDDRVDLSVEGVAHLARAAAAANKSRLLISFCVNDSSLACATACARAGITVAGIASVHSAALLAEAYPDLCAGVSDRNAVATTLVVQDSRAGQNIGEAEKLLHKRLRAEGLQLKACRRSRFATASNVVDALLPASGAAYEHEATWSKPADHQFLGRDNARLFSALYAPPRTPRDFMSTYVKCSVGSLDRELLKVVLKELLPSATFDDGVVAFAAQSNSTTSRPPLKALFDIARNKVRAKRDGEQRLKELPRDIEHWKGLYKDSVSLLRGGVDALDGFVDLSVDGRPLLRPAALDGNRRVVGCTPLPETHGACSGQRFVGLKVRRGVAGKALDHLLGLAATTPRIARPRREEKSLTRDERVRICKLAEDRPLPPGWAFDGACYVDGFGRRSRLRPDATELCLEWLEGVNAGVDAWNKAIAQQ